MTLRAAHSLLQQPSSLLLNVRSQCHSPAVSVRCPISLTLTLSGWVSAIAMSAAQPGYETRESAHTSACPAAVCLLPLSPPPPVAASPLRVLTLGDGNFSFSLALVRLYCPTKRERRRLLSSSPHSLPARSLDLVCSVYDSSVELAVKYPEAGEQRVEELRRRGAEVLFNVDATALDASIHSERARQRLQRCGERAGESEEASVQPLFDVIVFHHPHSGREDAAYHRRLLSHFFHSAASVVHCSSLVLLSLCDRQPWQWQLAESAERHGWRICDMGGWEAEMEQWTALGYESKRHHTGRQFNSHHVTLRHKVTLGRLDGDTQLPAIQAWREHFPLLLMPAQPPSSEQWTQLARRDEQAADEARLDSDSELAVARCPICQQAHSQQASRVQPRPLKEGQVACELCHVQFTNQRALQQHTAAMEGRDDHIELAGGEGKRTRHRKLRTAGVMTREMRERGERIKEKRRERRSGAAHGEQQPPPQAECSQQQSDTE